MQPILIHHQLHGYTLVTQISGSSMRVRMQILRSLFSQRFLFLQAR